VVVNSVQTDTRLSDLEKAVSRLTSVLESRTISTETRPSGAPKGNVFGRQSFVLAVKRGHNR